MQPDVQAYLAVQLGELCMPIREGSDLCRAHKGEVKGVEEQHNVLALQAPQDRSALQWKSTASLTQKQGLYPVL